ncbi:lycopene cyclase family protein [Winogradskyella sp.]|uniref:lycopene cyclase family protein n=1 Tax=Winogradskyella sp. TaxID=1883156 RepID=UPI003F6C5347
MIHKDYIIVGAGASGLMLAYRMSQDTFFSNKSILIIDKEQDKGNDRTWCFWEEGSGEWDHLLYKYWSKIYFGSDAYSRTIDISDYSYKMIRSESFYKQLWGVISSKSNIEFRKESVVSVNEQQDGAEVITSTNTFRANKVFNSIPNAKLYNLQKKYPVLQQHFIGWFIKTKQEVFDDSVATFMDFTVKQKENTRFMYVLPIDKTTALFEYTLFSKDLLQTSDYEEAIKLYLVEKGITDYEIIEKEKGSIPMTSYEFSKHNSEHVLNIGTAGGWTKASTGYTFRNTTKKTKILVDFLKNNNDLSKFDKATKFRLYDMLFLDVLANHNEKGAKLFSSLFKKAKTKTIFRFLDEESSFLEDLKIITSVPPKDFTLALLKRLF